jgi:hypothetical protein
MALSIATSGGNSLHRGRIDAKFVFISGRSKIPVLSTLSKYRPKHQRRKLTQQEKFLEMLTDSEAPENISGHAIAQRLGIDRWSDVSTNVMTASIKERALPNLGWSYEAKRGPGGGSRFMKTENAVFRLGVAK